MKVGPKKIFKNKRTLTSIKLTVEQRETILLFYKTIQEFIDKTIARLK